jgi:hypothetical protein
LRSLFAKNDGEAHAHVKSNTFKIATTMNLPRPCSRTLARTVVAAWFAASLWFCLFAENLEDGRVLWLCSDSFYCSGRPVWFVRRVFGALGFVLILWEDFFRVFYGS